MAAAVAGGAGESAWSQGSWVRRPVPDGRFRHALAYDSARGRVVLFGGDRGSWLADTWEYDGANWALRTPATSPPARKLHALAYDSARGKVVLFGGIDGGSVAALLTDTGSTSPPLPSRPTRRTARDAQAARACRR